MDEESQSLQAQSRLPHHVKTLIEWAAINQPQLGQSEYSKSIKFNLSYQASVTCDLEPVFARIEAEITSWEAETGRRKNKRSKANYVRFLAAVRTLSLNLVHSKKMMPKDLYLTLSFNNNDYGQKKRYAPHDVSIRPLRDAFYGMKALGYLSIHRNGYFERENGTGEYTRFEGTAMLFDAIEAVCSIPDISFKKASQPDETILLRNEDGKSEDYTDTSNTNAMRHNLSRINEVLEAHECKLAVPEDMLPALEKRMERNYDEEGNKSLPYLDYTATRLYRIFNENFCRGGRFHRGWWQNIPKEFRKFIQIDSAPTVELDYSALHPAILYAENGLSMQGDPYDICPKSVLRKHGKIAFNALLNAKYKNPNPPASYHQLETDGIPWEEFLKKMLEHHAPIRDCFLDGYGLTIQYEESKLAEAVLLHFADNHIPCLPIHDGFIVAQQHEHELQEVMEQAFISAYGCSVMVHKAP